MAEYYMTYQEFSDFIDECIDKSKGNKDFLKANKAYIMTALLSDGDVTSEDGQAACSDLYELWNNQLQKPSQILLGKRYIPIKSAMLDFIMDGLFLSGVFENALYELLGEGPAAFSVATCASVVLAVMTLLNRSQDLEDHDYCVFLQAKRAKNTYETFTKNDLIEWMPAKGRKCNMPCGMWDCCYRGTDPRKPNVCGILKGKVKARPDGREIEEPLMYALASLEQKKILSKTVDGTTIYYQFVK